MNGRRHDGYEARSRIASAGRGRSRGTLAAIAVAAAWIFIIVSSPRPAPVAVPTPRGTDAGATWAPSGSARPPGVFRGPNAPTAAIPVGTDTWIEPASMRLIGGGMPWIPKAFMLADGSRLCVCLEPADASSPTVTVHFYRVPIEPGPANDDEINGLPVGDSRLGRMLEAALLPDATAVVLAIATPMDDGWSVRLERRLPDGTLVAKATIAELDRTTLAGLDPNGIGVWMAADGAHVRVRLFEATEGTLGGSFIWHVPVEADGFGPGVRTIEKLPPSAQTCLVEAWATNRDFARVCIDFKFGPERPWLVASLEAPDGAQEVIEFTSAAGANGGSGWLVDARAGAIYGWFAANRRVLRIDVPSRTIAERTWGIGAVHPQIDGSTPSSRPGSALWAAALAPADQLRPPNAFMNPFLATNPVVGSADGSILYVATTGPAEPQRPDAEPQFGVWAVDAANLLLVATWPALAEYQGLALSPDGRFLYAVGSPLFAERSQFGSTGLVLVAHDVLDGEAVLVARGVTQLLGIEPEFLVTGPSP